MVSWKTWWIWKRIAMPLWELLTTVSFDWVVSDIGSCQFWIGMSRIFDRKSIVMGVGGIVICYRNITGKNVLGICSTNIWWSIVSKRCVRSRLWIWIWDIGVIGDIVIWVSIRELVGKNGRGRLTPVSNALLAVGSTLSDGFQTNPPFCFCLALLRFVCLE